MPVRLNQDVKIYSSNVLENVEFKWTSGAGLFAWEAQEQLLTVPTARSAKNVFLMFLKLIS